ncbi:MAG: penicillin-binding protein 2 [Candidatus Colwellbacteria bacterium]|nr:penicillin-binding protein 2 [Candidatus Colwellbacteria bacterium]
MGIRFALVFSAFALLYGSLGVRLYHLQILKGGDYAAKAEARHSIGRIYNPVRGNIFFTDKSGAQVPVAIKKDYPYVYCVPSEIASSGSDIKEVAAKLLPFIPDVAEDKLIEKLDKKDDPYEELIKEPDAATVSAIEALGIEGVKIEDRSRRYYPYGSIGGQVIGFVSGSDGIGQYGLESFYEDTLKGRPGEAIGDQISPQEDGEDIYMTIDQNIQSKAEKILGDAVSKYKAKSGLVIVSDPKTGAILAMAGNPTFDPNSYGKISDQSWFKNTNIQEVYEPGSVFKLVTIASALDAGKVTPDTTYVDTGSATINGFTIRNWDHKAHGKLTMTEVIEQSINTGTIFAMNKMGHDLFYDYVKKFGFMEKTGIDLPGERIGSTSTIVDGVPVNYATASYGQGISVTPIRMLSAVNAIANGGVMMRPHLMIGESKEIGRPISKDTAKKVVDMMTSAVVKNKLAAIENYNVAGKTGTALVPNIGGKPGYKDNAVINTYVGFAPSYDPKFSILIRLDEPEGAPLAGQTIVPAFRDLAYFILNYYNVAPDKLN